MQKGGRVEPGGDTQDDGLHLSTSAAQTIVLVGESPELFAMERATMRCAKAVAWGLTLVLVCVAGCGQPGTAPTLKVTGTVTLDGTPIEGVGVTFFPEEGRPASGVTDGSGKFTLSTFEPGDGAVPGRHKVAMGEQPDESAPMPGTPEAENWTPPEPRFPDRYSDPEKSGFEAQVERGQQEFTFNMDSK